MKVALYARVATSNQTIEQQLEELRGVAKAAKLEVIAELQGAEIKRLIELVQLKEVQAVLSCKLAGIGDSGPHLARITEKLAAHDIALIIPGQHIDTRNSPAGRLQLHMLAAFAEFERSLISERTKLKLQAMKAAGVELGRPKVSEKTLAAAKAMITESIATTGKQPTCKFMAESLDISIGLAHRIRKELLTELNLTGGVK